MANVKLKNKVKGAGLTQEKAAEIVGVPSRTFRKYLFGSQQPREERKCEIIINFNKHIIDNGKSPELKFEQIDFLENNESKYLNNPCFVTQTLSTKKFN